MRFFVRAKNGLLLILLAALFIPSLASAAANFSDEDFYDLVRFSAAAQPDDANEASEFAHLWVREFLLRAHPGNPNFPTRARLQAGTNTNDSPYYCWSRKMVEEFGFSSIPSAAVLTAYSPLLTQVVISYAQLPVVIRGLAELENFSFRGNRSFSPHEFTSEAKQIYGYTLSSEHAFSHEWWEYCHVQFDNSPFARFNLADHLALEAGVWVGILVPVGYFSLRVVTAPFSFGFYRSVLRRRLNRELQELGDCPKMLQIVRRLA